MTVLEHAGAHATKTDNVRHAFIQRTTMALAGRLSTMASATETVRRYITHSDYEAIEGANTVSRGNEAGFGSGPILLQKRLRCPGERRFLRLEAAIDGAVR